MKRSTGDFFAGHRRREKLQQFTKVLDALTRLVDWAALAKVHNAATGREASQPKGGRPPYATDVMLKIMVLQQLYGNLSDEEMEYALLDRASWLVVNKPAGLASVPAARRPGEDIVSVLGLAPAHRLDRFTTGCLVLTRDAEAARFFEAAFREGRIHKEYVAIVEGVPTQDAFEIDAPLGHDEGSRVPGKMAVRPDGAQALTLVEVIERLSDRTIVRARPRTGRKHQIRAHLAHAGLPIVGDLLYGGDERRFVRFQLGQRVDTPEGLVPGRHLLHARALEFAAPEGDSVIIEAPWPDDFPQNSRVRPQRTV